MRFLILFCLFSSAAFSQLKKSPPPVYKTIDAKEFNAGDRIAIGGITTELVSGKYQKYRVVVSDSMPVFREFLFAHPNIEFHLEVKWKQMGRKFPSETSAVKDTLEQYFRKPQSSADNRLYISTIHHSYVKQEDYIQMELVVLSVKPKTTGLPKVINSDFPGKAILYNNYRNKVEFTVPGIPADEATWMEGDYGRYKYIQKGKLEVRTAHSPEELIVTICSGTAENKKTHGTYWFSISDMPQPELLLGTVNIRDSASALGVSIFRDAEYSAVYPSSSPLKAVFKVSEVDYLVAGKKYSQSGSKIPEKVLKALEKAPAGSEIVITKIAVNGPKRFKYRNVLKVVK